MIKEKTLFIIGAGANHPYGFPTGATLYSNIYKYYSIELSQLINNEIALKEGKSSPIFHQEIDIADKFCKALNYAQESSIDKYLSNNPGFGDTGKFAITYNILNKEYQSKKNWKERKFPNDWLTYFLNRIMAKAIKPDSFNKLLEADISFISFNYDRLLEYFLYKTITHRYISFTNQQKIIDTLRKIKILHVYGKLSELPYKMNNSNETIIDYGTNPSYRLIKEVANNIRIIYDRTNESLQNVKVEIKQAKRIFFLGFGYADENLEVLDIPNILNEKQFIYGTAFQSTRREIEEIINKLTNPNLDRSKMIIEDKSCLELLREYL